MVVNGRRQIRARIGQAVTRRGGVPMFQQFSNNNTMCRSLNGVGLAFVRAAHLTHFRACLRQAIRVLATTKITIENSRQLNVCISKQGISNDTRYMRHGHTVCRYALLCSAGLILLGGLLRMRKLRRGITMRPTIHSMHDRIAGLGRCVRPTLSASGFQR